MQMGKVRRLILFTVMTTVVAFGLSTTGVVWAQDDTGSTLDAIVVTGKVGGEERRRSPTTIWVIDEEQIEKSNASSIAELLSNASIGYISQFAVGSSGVNIRGGKTNGQGRDFMSWSMILVNGRRAGTSNVAKLSPNQVSSIEIMRGPTSVMYGSQAMGGIINIITKDGRNTEGGLIDTRIGSAGLTRTYAEYATTLGEEESIATYLGGTYGEKGNYDGGGNAGTQVNTTWERRSGLGNISWNPNDNNSLSLTVRSDGHYDTGFRGSGGLPTTKEDRFNHSLDLIWDFEAEDLPARWRVHNYFVYDEDSFRWAFRDQIANDNTRRLYIMGIKVQPTFNLFENNELVIGFDAEQSRLDSNRKYGTVATGLVPSLPLDMNQTDQFMAVYAEDTHHFFDNRLLLRGGVRYTSGTTTVEPTPNVVKQVSPSTDYDHLTWSVGANFEATDNITLRIGASTGFRSPTASELAGARSQVGTMDKVTFGSKDVTPETSEQYEIGMFVSGEGWYVDTAWFYTEIADQITTTPYVLQPSSGREHRYYRNSDGLFKVSGLELDSRLHIDQLTDLGNWQWSLGLSANYNLKMFDGSSTIGSLHNRDKITGTYEYQGSFFTQFGQDSTVSNPWSVRLTGVLYGPFYVDPERELNPQFEPNSTYRHHKGSFMVWDLNAELALNDQWSVYGGIDNMFDKNDHPAFIDIDNGTDWWGPTWDWGQDDGTSMPGREFYVGLKLAF